MGFSQLGRLLGFMPLESFAKTSAELCVSVEKIVHDVFSEKEVRDSIRHNPTDSRSNEGEIGLSRCEALCGLIHGNSGTGGYHE